METSQKDAVVVQVTNSLNIWWQPQELKGRVISTLTLTTWELSAGSCEEQTASVGLGADSWWDSGPVGVVSKRSQA